MKDWSVGLKVLTIVTVALVLIATWLSVPGVIESLQG